MLTSKLLIGLFHFSMFNSLQSNSKKNQYQWYPGLLLSGDHSLNTTSKCTRDSKVDSPKCDINTTETFNVTSWTEATFMQALESRAKLLSMLERAKASIVPFVFPGEGSVKCCSGSKWVKFKFFSRKLPL